ncbi:hypothetical protein XTPLMG730_3657 [Xanthomonas translucens pv. phlei]|uniref:Uncharacterized protein n=1 Tax=Xanthomonas graminis pv. phlei TaxID=487906 RepID=A0A0K3A437_9XANT|nr:hypothetical protein XTPLMG730_3657 [Xanthomonas translucens pv. phlei]
MRSCRSPILNPESLLQTNSACGSCRVRSWAASILDAGDAEWHPSWWPFQTWSERARETPNWPEPEKLQKGGTIYAGASPRGLD